MNRRREAATEGVARTLEERVQRLAQEKSFLQLVISLTNRMIAVSGLDSLADCVLQGLAEMIGGTNLALWYRVDDSYRCHTLTGPPRIVEAPDDADVAAVFADGRARDREGAFAATRMTTRPFGEARTWIQPLAAGHGVVGVLRLENLHSGLEGAAGGLQTLFAYVGMALNNALTDHDRQRELDFIQRVFDSTDAHMAVVARDGTILAVNSAWTRFARENGCVGASWGVGASYFRSADARHGDTTAADEAYAGIQRVQEGEASSFTVEYPCHDPAGRERWFVLHVLPLQGAEGSVLVSHQDVTARRQAEHDLRQNERILQASQALARVGGWEIDLARGEWFWTAETFRIHGMRTGRSGPGGTDLIDASLACYDEDDRPVVMEALRRCREDGVPYDLEFPFTPCGGRRGWIRTTAAPVQRDGRIVAVVGTIMDITDRRMHEIERVKLEKLESLGLLAGGIAHDFNNILTAVIGNLSLAQVTLPPAHAAGPIMAEAERAATRAGALAHQLLTFARGGEPVRATVELGPLVHEAVALVLRGTNVRAEVTVDPGLGAVLGDANQLVQVCNNIAINAAQAMPGGGRLAVTARNLDAEEAAAAGLPSCPQVELAFADEGPGIADDDLERIFDPYFTTKPTGNGLGLASVHSIIARHGGTIRAESAPGGGATFRLFLPSLGRVAVPAAATAPAAAVAGAGAGGGRVLIMDDEAGIRSLGAAMARRLGWIADTCGDGGEAVRIYQAELDAGRRYDAVVMDLTIPGGMGGREAAATILACDPQAHLIVSSGYSNDPVMSDVASCGFRGAVAKPYNFARFGEELAKAAPRGGSGPDPD